MRAKMFYENVFLHDQSAQDHWPSHTLYLYEYWIKCYAYITNSIQCGVVTCFRHNNGLLQRN